MLDHRIAFKLRVSQGDIWGGLLPENAFREIWNSSNGRPREAIRLATLAATTAVEEGHTKITSGDIISAIRRFSNERIREVTGEWTYQFPGIELIVRKMEGWPKEFAFSQIEELVEITHLEIQCGDPGSNLYSWVTGFAGNPMGFARVLLNAEILWIKRSRTDDATVFDPLRPVELTKDRWFAIHPMFAPGLGLVGA
ncbi:hypothetical protein KOR42_50820 [Thalassoglobus neptunius]|uniref:Uncharacterized protein n=2 Tax=Thalassoglobus neptunius TaxID=1938619 RepID=A0A5C5VMJ2_9PLAN|nr:hypothetical protein KOR42_50820 [Thalassoglobus neptunius]